MTDADKPAVSPAAPTVKPAKKTAPKAETFEAFALPKTEIPEAFREFAEQGVKTAKDGYEKLRTMAEQATDVIEDQYETSRAGLVEFTAKALDAAKTNTDATFKLASDLLTVKTVAEVIELQTSFARQQYETVSAQAKEMQALAAKIAGETAQPVKDAFAKLLKEAKAA